MKHLKTYKLFENFNKNSEIILSTVNDILLELSDDGFEVYTRYWVGGRVAYNRVAENIEVRITSSRKYEIDDIIEVYNRLCEYLYTWGFEKDLLARDGKVGSIPHLRIFEFMNTYSSTFSFSALTVNYEIYKQHKIKNETSKNI